MLSAALLYSSFSKPNLKEQPMLETLEATPATPTPAADLDAVNWFEIPTGDLDRATDFYELLLGTPLRREVFGERMTLFPATQTGVGGALVHRASQQPSACGALVYLNCDSGIAAAIERMEAGKRGTLIVPITSIGAHGAFAIVRDSEGNHIGLHEH
jgi:predicted enzyme related to lactoylglutathione lyase